MENIWVPDTWCPSQHVQNDIIWVKFVFLCKRRLSIGTGGGFKQVFISTLKTQLTSMQLASPNMSHHFLILSSKQFSHISLVDIVQLIWRILKQILSGLDFYSPIMVLRFSHLVSSYFVSDRSFLCNFISDVLRSSTYILVAYFLFQGTAFSCSPPHSPLRCSEVCIYSVLTHL